MSSFIGIGTSLYGEKGFDKSTRFYTATRWFTVFLLPIIPLATYKVKRVSTKLTGLVPVVGVSTQYETIKIDLDWNQVFTTYLLVYGTIALIILTAVYLPDFWAVPLIGAVVLIVGL